MRVLLPTVRSILLVAGLLLLASCGDDPVDLGSGQPGEDEQPIQDVEDPNATQPDDGADSGYERTVSRPELVSAAPAMIDELVVADEGRTVLVRYQNAAEPCAWAHVVTTETETTVEVALETGLHPNAAAMTCIAQVIAYEIEVALSEPLGQRELIAVAAAAVPPAAEDPFEGAEFPTDQYIGLTQAEAEALGDVEQRVVRVSRIDDEILMLTMDFSATRVNIELEDGIVVVATSG